MVLQQFHSNLNRKKKLQAGSNGRLKKKSCLNRTKDHLSTENSIKQQPEAVA